MSEGPAACVHARGSLEASPPPPPAGRTLGPRCPQPGPSAPGGPPAPSPRAAEGRGLWTPCSQAQPTSSAAPWRESGLGRVVVWPQEGGTPSAETCERCREAGGRSSVRVSGVCACVRVRAMATVPTRPAHRPGKAAPPRGRPRSLSSRGTCLAQGLSSFLHCYLAAQLVLPKAGRAGWGEGGRVPNAEGRRGSAAVLILTRCFCVSVCLRFRRPSDVLS